MTISDGQGLGTITDNDSPPTLIVSDVVPHRTPPTGTASGQRRTPRSRGPPAKPITVKFATANGSATSSGLRSPGTPSTVTFNPGHDHQDAGGQHQGRHLRRTRPEPVHEPLRTGERVPARIHLIPDHPYRDNRPDPCDCDQRPHHHRRQYRERRTSPSPITLTNPSDSTINVEYATENATATAPSDYGTQDRHRLLRPRIDNKTQPPTSRSRETATAEPDETFVVTLTNPTNAAFNDATGQGTIQNDD